MTRYCVLFYHSSFGSTTLINSFFVRTVAGDAHVAYQTSIVAFGGGSPKFPTTFILVFTCFTAVVTFRLSRSLEDAKCIVVTRVCVSVCVFVSVRGRMPALLYGPGCNVGEW